VSAARMWSALIGHAGGEGAVCGNYMPTEPGQDTSLYNLPIVRDLGQPPVRTYLSHFLTFSDILLK
jgi:hypothetical protein